MKKKFLPVLLFFVQCIFLAEAQNFSALKHYQRGREFEAEEDWYSAGEEFHLALQENPAFGEAWLELSKVSYELNDFELCLSYIENTEKYIKDRPDVLNLKGMCLISLRRLEEAEGVFKEILKKYPNNVEARFGLAEIELYNGSFDKAQSFYLDALKRQGTNRKALLSLAVLAAETGKTDLSENYIRQALKSHPSESEVWYFASYLRAKNGDFVAAEKYARDALQLNGNYEQAYLLLSSILYEQKKYAEVIDICDYLIDKDRNTVTAWYLKGLALYRQKKIDLSIEAFSTALAIEPEDEILRSALELIIDENLPLEDSRRSVWAQYHVLKAREYSRFFKGEQARYEYQRALKIDPNSISTRSEFAREIYKLGQNELYLNQLLFIKNREKVDLNGLSEEERHEYTKTNDQIEALSSLQKYSLSAKWNVEPFYLDKTRWNLGLYYTKNNASLLHPDCQEIAAEMARESFNGIAVTAVNVEKNPVSGFGEAFSAARKNSQDYFILMDFEESEREVCLDAFVYNGRNGIQVAKISLFRTGNDRFSSIIRSFRRKILDILPARGKILARNGNEVLVDMGKNEGMEAGVVLDVIKKGSIRTADSAPGVAFEEKSLLGQIEIERADEEISQGILKQNSFYDRVNVGDEVLVKAVPETGGEVPAERRTSDTAPSADENGNSYSRSEKLTAEDLGLIKTPVFLDLIRKIY